MNVENAVIAVIADNADNADIGPVWRARAVRLRSPAEVPATKSFRSRASGMLNPLPALSAIAAFPALLGLLR